MMKMDSGPGRFNPEFLTKLRARCFAFYPAVLNSSQLPQEADQMLEDFKSNV